MKKLFFSLFVLPLVLQAQTPLLYDTDDNGLLDTDEMVIDNSLIPHVSRVLNVTNGYVAMPDQSRFALDSWTVMAWVTTLSGDVTGQSTGGGTIISRKIGEIGYNYKLELVSGYPQISFTSDDGATNVLVKSNKRVWSVTWSHVTASFNGDSGRLTLFIDGKVAGTITTRKSPLTTGAGEVQNRIGEGFEGQIDEVGIFSSSMSEGDLVQLMEGIIWHQDKYPSLISYYMFDDGTSAVGPDGDGKHYGTSGVTNWWCGQVQEFAAGFENDWETNWENAGTLHGSIAMSAPSEQMGYPTSDRWEFIADFDCTEDWWESLFHPSYASSAMYDSHLDPDGDGWDNWSEARYTAKTGNRCSPGDASEYPIPEVLFTFKCDKLPSGRITVLAYSNPEMQGKPDATFVFSNPAEYTSLSSISVHTTEPTVGYLRQGINWFFAFDDANNNKVWNTGEHAGLASYDIGWDKNEVEFVLTESAPNGYIRDDFSLVAPIDNSRFDVEVLRNFKDQGTNVFTIAYTKTIRNRTWFHEGDIDGPGLDFWLDWSLSPFIFTTMVYRLRVNGNLLINTHVMRYTDTQLPTPVAVSPINSSDQSFARPIFKWYMSRTASAFKLEIANKYSPESVLYTTCIIPAPPARDLNGLRYFSPVIHWGDILPSGDITDSIACRWRVRAYQPYDFEGTVSAWSEENVYVGLAGRAIPGIGNVKVRVTASYIPTSPQTIRVQAFTTASFNGPPVVQKSVTGVTGAQLPIEVDLARLPLNRPYYILAYLDQNNNNKRDERETFGYYKAGGMPKKGVWYFQPQPIHPAHEPDTPVIDVIMLSTDVDQNRIVDSYEDFNH